MNNISKETWKEILDVLKEHKISYTVNYECDDIQVDKYIHIDLAILDYFKDE